MSSRYTQYTNIEEEKNNYQLLGIIFDQWKQRKWMLLT